MSRSGAAGTMRVDSVRMWHICPFGGFLIFVDRLKDGLRRLRPSVAAVVRIGYLPKREILTPVGAVSVRVPNVRDPSGTRARFN